MEMKLRYLGLIVIKNRSYFCVLRRKSRIWRRAQPGYWVSALSKHLTMNWGRAFSHSRPRNLGNWHLRLPRLIPGVFAPRLDWAPRQLGWQGAGSPETGAGTGARSPQRARFPLRPDGGDRGAQPLRRGRGPPGPRDRGSESLEKFHIFTTLKQNPYLGA